MDFEIKKFGFGFGWFFFFGWFYFFFSAAKYNDYIQVVNIWTLNPDFVYMCTFDTSERGGGLTQGITNSPSPFGAALCNSCFVSTATSYSS